MNNITLIQQLSNKIHISSVKMVYATDVFNQKMLSIDIITKFKDHHILYFFNTGIYYYHADSYSTIESVLKEIENE
jgi:hypothetical protein